MVGNPAAHASCSCCSERGVPADLTVARALTAATRLLRVASSPPDTPQVTSVRGRMLTSADREASYTTKRPCVEAPKHGSVITGGPCQNDTAALTISADAGIAATVAHETAGAWGQQGCPEPAAAGLLSCCSPPCMCRRARAAPTHLHCCCRRGAGAAGGDPRDQVANKAGGGYPDGANQRGLVGQKHQVVASGHPHVSCRCGRWSEGAPAPPSACWRALMWRLRPQATAAACQASPELQPQRTNHEHGECAATGRALGQAAQPEAGGSVEDAAAGHRHGRRRRVERHLLKGGSSGSEVTSTAVTGCQHICSAQPCNSRLPAELKRRQVHTCRLRPSLLMLADTMLSSEGWQMDPQGTSAGPVVGLQVLTCRQRPHSIHLSGVQATNQQVG